MTIIPTAAKIAKPAVCLGPIRLNAPSTRIATIAHRPGLFQRQSVSCVVRRASGSGMRMSSPGSCRRLGDRARRRRVVAEAEVVERFDGAERGGDGVVGEEQQRADDAEDAAAAPAGGVDAAAVGVEAADLRVGPADDEDQQAHRADEPEAGPPGDEERQAQHVEPAGAPVAEEQGAGLEPVDVPRPLAGEHRQCGRLLGRRRRCRCRRCRPCPLSRLVHVNRRGREAYRRAID